MQAGRTKNAVRNIISGSVLKLYQIVMPFILRTAMIYYLGMEYVGLNSLFSSVLSVLNLAELGVGTAMVFSMYKPIADNDSKTICALMRMYKIYYRIIGLVIMVIGTILIPFLPKLISGSIPTDINIYVIYVLNMLSTVLSYWLFAYKSCLFSAHQRSDITSKVTIFISTVTYVFQFIVLVTVKSYYIYLIVGIVTQVLQNIISAVLATRKYPQYIAKGKLSLEIRKSINQRVRDLFTSKIGGIILNSADTIVISAFLGITTLGIYNNYFYILSSVIGFCDIIFYACTAGIGNSIIVESKEKNFNDFSTLTFIIGGISTLGSACFLNLYQPFMYIWMNGNTDRMLDFRIVICLCIYFFVYEINRVANVYKDAAGIWHVDRYRPLVTASVNLVLNLILVNFIGLFGVVLSTIFATIFVNCPWLYSKLFTTIFSREKLLLYIKKVLVYAMVTVVAMIISYMACSFIIDISIVTIIIRLIIIVLVTSSLMFIVYRKTKEYSSAKLLMNRILGHMLKR